MSSKLETAEQYGEHSDEAVGLMIQIDEIEAEQAASIDLIKAGYSPQIDTLKKELKSLKSRLTNYAKNQTKAVKIFAGNTTGIFTTNRAQVTLKKNPSSIAIKDKSTDLEELILAAKKKGFGNVIIPSEKFSLEAMEKLSDEELDRIGWKRIRERKTFSIKPTEGTRVAEKSVIEQP